MMTAAASMPIAAAATHVPLADAQAQRLALEAHITAACKRIAPLWPLKHFVAVNPFLGFSGETFAETAAYLKRTARTHMLMPRSFYREALTRGAIDDAALTLALQASPARTVRFADVAAVRAAAAAEPASTAAGTSVVATVAEVLHSVTGIERNVSLVGFMIDEISSFCAAYFDEGQASWRLPVRQLKPYAAWRALLRHDRNPEMMGVTGFRDTVLALPAHPVDTITAVLTGLGIPARAVEDYLFRSLFDINGWAAYARYIGWDAELDGKSDDTLLELLAIRVAWGYGIFRARSDDAFRTAWAKAMVAAAQMPDGGGHDDDADLALEVLLQDAYEIAYRARLTSRLTVTS